MTTEAQRPAITLEYFGVEITTSSVLDAQPVHLAFVDMDTASSPVSGDWKVAAWVGTAGTTRTARVLLGPAGAVTLAPGKYMVWYKVTDSPEIPARPVGVLSIT
ncbi:hypothetical protein [Streptomyces sp.]|uniref:hypothetical protein n=1 Tax=Streptomyces sp. TaxID=1931 RepID=UPI002F94B3AF